MSDQLPPSPGRNGALPKPVLATPWTLRALISLVIFAMVISTVIDTVRDAWHWDFFGVILDLMILATWSVAILTMPRPVPPSEVDGTDGPAPAEQSPPRP